MKTLLIGLDGATFTVLDPLMADGHMPFLKTLVQNGSRASLYSTPNPLTPPAWTTIATGRSPGNHGIYDFVRGDERDGSFYYTLYNSSDNLCETIWSMASRNNRKTILMNYPMTAPPEPINGVVIPSMVQWRHMRKNIHPESAMDIIKAIPDFNPDEWGLTYSEANEAMRLRAQNPKEEKEWVHKNTKRDFQWFNIFSWFMKNQECDLNTIVFDGVDKLQHLCWYLIDPAHLPEAPEKWELRMREYILEYFRSIDSYLKTFLDTAGPEANLFIVSDHGFGPTKYVFHINVFLEQMGYLKWLDQPQRTGRDTNHEWSYSSLDWQHTSVYGGTPSSNGIWLRAPGDPGQNTLSAEEYEALKKRVTRDLLDFRDPITGEQIVSKVTPREKAFPGAAMNSAPDLLLTLSDNSFVSVVQHENVVYHRPKVNGTHNPEGILIAHGPHIKNGAKLPDLSVLDVAPTILYSLNIPVPDNLEGKVVEECFSADFLRKQPVNYCKGEDKKNIQSPSESSTPFNEEEEQAIFAQLRELGYME